VTPHAYNARIYYADTDAGGVVYHANYLALAEQARTECLRDLGLPHALMTAEHDCVFMVRRVNLEYLRPARLDDMLTITTTFLAQTAATLSLRQVFALAGQTAEYARLLVELVCVSASTGKPVRTPPRWRFDLI
jgi:acyl-CoA thioester hydrolase